MVFHAAAAQAALCLLGLGFAVCFDLDSRAICLCDCGTRPFTILALRGSLGAGRAYQAVSLQVIHSP